MKVRLKNEIVSLGQGVINVNKFRGQLVAPHEWNKLVTDKKVKLIDVRNSYEINIGKFKRAINPKTKNFREFPDSFNKLKINKNDKIAMYCTGGIRCEKASSFLKKEGYKNIFQLRGGIVNYLKYTKKNGSRSFWNGECFVFDERVAINKNLEKGKYLQCYGCRRPIKGKDLKSIHYKKGIQCPYCYNLRSKKQIKRSTDRQSQIDIAIKNKSKNVFIKNT